MKKTVRVFALLFTLAVVCGGSAFAQSLPGGWTSVDIGAVGAAGKASGTAASFTVEGAGADIWGRADAFRFIYSKLSGDGSVVTQVTSEEHVASWTKAGVMMRETLAAGSRQASMFVSPGKGLAFQRRSGANSDSTHTSGGSGTAPYFVKLQRRGNTFTAYKSVDGTNWKTVGSQKITMASKIYVGVVVSSHVKGTLATARFASTKVTAGKASGGGDVVETAPPPPPAASGSSSSGTSVKLLHWNAHHGGIGTDGRYDPARIAAWVAKINPQIVDFNQVDNSSQVAAILSALNAKTGGGWKAYAAWKTVIMTKLPVDASAACTFDAGQGFKAAHVSVIVNGRPINLWTTHLDVDSAGNRLKEAGAMQSCAKAWSEAHVIAGDFNMQSSSKEYKAMAKYFDDAWMVAKSRKATSNYSGNCDGCTRNSRIDYVFVSKGQSFATVKSAQIIDTRDSHGKMPSDHKPMLVTLSVK
jgi:endonuclease/exonuclease/phosphatase family metal-dependent hydrolase